MKVKVLRKSRFFELRSVIEEGNRRRPVKHYQIAARDGTEVLNFKRFRSALSTFIYFT